MKEPLLFELSDAGQYNDYLAPLDVPEAPLEFCRARNFASARSGRAFRRAPFHAAFADELHHRHRILSARLLHHEVQPEAQRSRGGACRALRACIRCRTKRRCRAGSEVLLRAQDVLAQIAGLRCRNGAAARGRAGRILRAFDDSRLSRKARRAGTAHAHRGARFGARHQSGLGGALRLCRHVASLRTSTAVSIWSTCAPRWGRMWRRS